MGQNHAAELDSRYSFWPVYNDRIAGQAAKPTVVLVIVSDGNNVGFKSNGLMGDLTIERTRSIGVNEDANSAIRYARKTCVAEINKPNAIPRRSCSR
jgi:hypothetical protein